MENYDFDIPEAFDQTLMMGCINKLKVGSGGRGGMKRRGRQACKRHLTQQGI